MQAEMAVGESARISRTLSKPKRAEGINNSHLQQAISTGAGAASLRAVADWNERKSFDERRRAGGPEAPCRDAQGGRKEKALARGRGVLAVEAVASGDHGHSASERRLSG
ncbi:bll8248 [Bradyrhizobium diazoefficiens USDA 110]|uniref:Bll8248 protein n=2 Tax=Bradyrhizobium TaxID=374 RepID=Q89BB4_BRADU|nr:hypothetical protein BD122_42135 [Bradyrhizobium diazoefficiens]AWL98088.1 hypothetical protein CIT37_15255 [Bradyrhizobium ottawaense]MYV88432.1 hypothetical protein [Bradyrhizobium japonicum]NLS74901.1 hypothetical protein [Bradyrhizobium brasilense]NWL43890.1 hypothetical protein [Bradyrhizobium elkanii]QOZ21477.1 hypothetical protein XI02_04735 [Bradyrhizobium sp. CCBAU 21365]BAC53513.1 bll8248 [Bradyrhizobium diazoefficiens USDA 110]